MSRKTSTRVVQVTGFLPFSVSHSWRISVLICSASQWFLRAMILTLDPFWSSKRRVPNWTYLVAISTGRLTTLPSVHVNLSSSGRVGSVPGLYVVCQWEQQKHSGNVTWSCDTHTPRHARKTKLNIFILNAISCSQCISWVTF